MRAPNSQSPQNSNRKKTLLTFAAWLLLFSPSLLGGKTDLPLLFLLLSALLFWPLALLRLVRMPAVLVLALLGAMNVLHSAYFGNLVDEYFIATASRSDLQESQEYLSTLSWQTCALVLGWLLLCSALGRYLWRNGPALVQSTLARRTAMVAVLFWVVFLSLALTLHWDAGDSLKKLRRLYPIHIAQAAERQNEIQDALFYKPVLPDAPAQDAQASTLVVVLGESATAQRWSLLGHAQADTNAPLAQLPGVASATVMAQGLTTSAALPFLLTGLSAHDSITQHTPSFLDWAQRAGYKVFVFTNSRFLNQYEDFSTQVLRRATQVYKKVGNGELDEVLTPFLAEALQDPAPRKLVVLHTYGSHPDVPKRYPQGRYHLPDVYDNSIRYTSDLLAQWIQLLEHSTTEPALLLYTSDHGLTVPPCGDTYRHGPSLSSLEVPFLAWGNAALRTQYPELMPPLQVQQPLQHSTTLLAATAIHAVGYGRAMATTAPWNTPQPLQFQQRTLTELYSSNACTLE